MTALDVERTLELLDKAVEDYGADYIDPASETGVCKYLYSNGCKCIAGWVLAEMGVSDETLSGLDGPIHALEVGNFDHVDFDGQYGYWLDGMTVEPDALSLLARAQLAQDNGGKWGEIVASLKAAQ